MDSDFKWALSTEDTKKFMKRVSFIDLEPFPESLSYRDVILGHLVIEAISFCSCLGFIMSTCPEKDELRAKTGWQPWTIIRTKKRKISGEDQIRYKHTLPYTLPLGFVGTHVTKCYLRDHLPPEEAIREAVFATSQLLRSWRVKWGFFGLFNWLRDESKGRPLHDSLFGSDSPVNYISIKQESKELNLSSEYLEHYQLEMNADVPDLIELLNEPYPDSDINIRHRLFLSALKTLPAIPNTLIESDGASRQFSANRISDYDKFLADYTDGSVKIHIDRSYALALLERGLLNGSTWWVGASFGWLWLGALGIGLLIGLIHSWLIGVGLMVLGLFMPFLTKSYAAYKLKEKIKDNERYYYVTMLNSQSKLSYE